MVKDEPVMIVIRGDLDEFNEDLDEADARKRRSEMGLFDLQQQSDEVQARIDDQRRDIESQMTQTMMLVGTSFGIIRNLLVVFGGSLTAIQQATLATIEAVIRTFTTVQSAFRLAQIGQLGPLGAALAVADVVATVSAIAMLVEAKDEARRQFQEINTRTIAAESALTSAFK